MTDLGQAGGASENVTLPAKCSQTLQAPQHRSPSAHHASQEAERHAEIRAPKWHGGPHVAAAFVSVSKPKWLWLSKPFWYHFGVGEFTTHFRTYSGWIGMFTGGTIWILTHINQTRTNILGKHRCKPSLRSGAQSGAAASQPQRAKRSSPGAELNTQRLGKLITSDCQKALLCVCFLFSTPKSSSKKRPKRICEKPA